MEGEGKFPDQMLAWHLREPIARMAFLPQKHSQVRSWTLSDDSGLVDRVNSFLARAAKPYGATLTVSLSSDEVVMLNAHFGQEGIGNLQSQVKKPIEQAQRTQAKNKHKVVVFITSRKAPSATK